MSFMDRMERVAAPPQEDNMDNQPGGELAVRDPQQLATWTPRFVTSLAEAKQMVQAKRDFMDAVLKDGIHYGIIPGTEKPSLLKPGAESLLANMGLHPVCSNESAPIVDLQGKTTGGEAFVAFDRKCSIYFQTGPALEDRVLIAEAGGYCHSWESKYRYRDEKKKCPSCGKATIIKGKQFDPKLAAQGVPGEWVCWKKGGGCGSSFAPNSPDGKKIEAQKVGRVPNPDVGDQVNTFKKMADKRAVIAAALLATGCSDIFTQDVEDIEHDVTPTAERPAASRENNGSKTGSKSRKPAASREAAPAAPPADDERRPLGVQEIIALGNDIQRSYGVVVDLAVVVAEFERQAKPGGPWHGFATRKPKVMTPQERFMLEDYLSDMRDGLDMAEQARNAQAEAGEPLGDEEEAPV